MPASDGKTYAWLRARTEIKQSNTNENGELEMLVALEPRQLQQLHRLSATITILPQR
jgi:hypothetical protein